MISTEVSGAICQSLLNRKWRVLAIQKRHGPLLLVVPDPVPGRETDRSVLPSGQIPTAIPVVSPRLYRSISIALRSRIHGVANTDSAGIGSVRFQSRSASGLPGRKLNLTLTAL